MHSKYPNLLGALIGVLAAAILTQIDPFVQFLLRLGEYGFISAFAAGVLFSSTFTTAIATVIFFYLGEVQNPLLMALAGGVGAMISDLLLYRFFRSHLFSELSLFFTEHHITTLKSRKLLHSKLFAWLGPVFASLIIMSPLPDEIGVAIFSFYKFDPHKLAPLSFLLNTAGILLILTLGSLAAQ
jgi:glucose-6-phosphate-specific signal transduction histidine kinase